MCHRDHAHAALPGMAWSAAINRYNAWDAHMAPHRCTQSCARAAANDDHTAALLVMDGGRAGSALGYGECGHDGCARLYVATAAANPAPGEFGDWTSFSDLDTAFDC